MKVRDSSSSIGAYSFVEIWRRRVGAVGGRECETWTWKETYRQRCARIAQSLFPDFDWLQTVSWHTLFGKQWVSEWADVHKDPISIQRADFVSKIGYVIVEMLCAVVHHCVIFLRRFKMWDVGLSTVANQMVFAWRCKGGPSFWYCSVCILCCMVCFRLCAYSSVVWFCVGG